MPELLLMVPIACSDALKWAPGRWAGRGWPFPFSFAEPAAPPADVEDEGGTEGLFGGVLSAEFFVALEAGLPGVFATALGVRFRAFDLTIVLYMPTNRINRKW